MTKSSSFFFLSWASDPSNISKDKSNQCGIRNQSPLSQPNFTDHDLQRYNTSNTLSITASPKKVLCPYSSSGYLN